MKPVAAASISKASPTTVRRVSHPETSQQSSTASSAGYTGVVGAYMQVWRWRDEIDRWNSLYFNQLSEKLHKLQNGAIRVISKSSYDTSSRFLLDLLGWDNILVRRAKQNTNLMYKCINNLAPAYLCNLFAPRTLNYNFCNAKRKLMLPKPRTDYLLEWRSSMEQSSWGNTYVKFLKLL